MKKLFKQAHKMTREIKIKYPNVSYQFQFTLCLKYLKTKKKEGIKMLKSGNEIRREYMKNKDLIQAIVDTTILLLDSEQEVLDKIPTNYRINKNDMKRGVVDKVLIDVISIITKIDNKERIAKCMYKARMEDKIVMSITTNIQNDLWGKLVAISHDTILPRFE